MKKRLIALLLALAFMMSFTCAAAYSQQEKTADALNELGLFLGTGKGYELEKKLTRAEGVTLLVRMIGKESLAKTWISNMPFVDVPSWAAGYIGYAYSKGITNGTGATTFGTDEELSDYMFLTLVLRALGYSDKAPNATFVWDQPYVLAKEVGLIEKAEHDTNFTRGDAIQIFWKAMSIKLVGKEVTLAKDLTEQGVFTAEEYKDAQEIQKNGRKENAGKPVIPSKPDNSEGNQDSGSDNQGDNTGSGNQSGGSGSDNTGSGNEGGSTGGENTGSGGTVDQPGTEEQPDDGVSYEEYNAMTAEQQQAFFNSFASPDAFFEWYNAAKAEYEANQNRIEIGEGGSIDLGDIINGNP